MMRVRTIAILLCALAAPAMAQLSLPPVGGVIDGVARTIPPTLDLLDQTVRSARELVEARLQRLGALVRSNRDIIERDENGEPAKAGEAILIDPDAASLRVARGAGFALIEQGEIEGLDVTFARLATPDRMPLDKALKRLRKLLPGKSVTADQLHFKSGGAAERVSTAAPRLAAGGTVGIIDGGVSSDIDMIESRRFAGSGGSIPDAHGTAIASLLKLAGVARIISADVYGGDPAGGNALAIARALGWMTALRVPVVTISLVGPANPLLARASAAAAARGTIVVAAVGNDGAAAPPAYPASYPDVIAVTGVDRRNRALIEAGRALHLDYAAPGADIVATGLDGKPRAVRGTSYAAPLVAARIAAAYASSPNRAALFARIDAEAIDLGSKGPDRSFGRGLLCGACRAPR